jgi:hypothetical protein
VKKIEKIASKSHHQPEIIGKMDILALKNTVIEFILIEFAILTNENKFTTKKVKAEKYII